MPCLVLLPNPAIFLVVIFFYSLLGVVIAFKKRTQRVNSFVLSLYPFIFHLCFMGIYWCKAPEYLILFQLACLATFLVGSAHYILTFTFEILAFGFKLMKKICASKNKVMPIH